MARSTEWMRLLDRTFGVAFLQLITAGRRRKALPVNPRTIGVILPTGIGDIVLSSGIFTALKDRYPDADIVAFHHENAAPAIRLVPVKMRLIECPFANPWSTIKMMRRARLDMVIDLWTWPRTTALFARLSAPVTIGFATPRHHRAAAYDLRIPHQADVHEICNYNAVADLFSNRPYRTDILTRPLAVNVGWEIERLVLCHVSAGGSRALDKAWPLANWVSLARRLVDQGWQLGFTGSRADAHVVEDILVAARLPPNDAVSLCGLVPLEQLGDLLRNARLLITIDTGVLHLAAAVDARMISLHGPTRAACWGARNANATCLDSVHPAAGYIRYGYETHRQGNQTMLAHTVDDVVHAATIKLAAQSVEAGVVAT